MGYLFAGKPLKWFNRQDVHMFMVSTFVDEFSSDLVFETIL